MNIADARKALEGAHPHKPGHQRGTVTGETSLRAGSKNWAGRDETVGAYLVSKLIVIVTLASIGWPLSIAGW